MQEVLGLGSTSAVDFDAVCMATALHKMASLDADPQQYKLLADRPELARLKQMICESSFGCTPALLVDSVTRNDFQSCFQSCIKCHQHPPTCKMFVQCHLQLQTSSCGMLVSYFLKKQNLHCTGSLFIELEAAQSLSIPCAQLLLLCALSRLVLQLHQCFCTATLPRLKTGYMSLSTLCTHFAWPKCASLHR